MIIINIYEKLSKIQNELKAPKLQRNNFGNYNYRSAEDILEAVKPICAKHSTTLTLSDKMLNIGDNVYVEATATLFDYEGKSIVVSASAREADTQKGMAPAQITGSSSSYARKYAMNGLFNIDDTKDDDFNNTHGKDTKPKKPHQPTPPTTPLESQLKNARQLIKNGFIDSDAVKKYYKVKSLEELSYNQVESVISKGNKNKQEGK